MAVRPLVARQHRIGMAGLTLAVVEVFVSNGIARDLTKCAPVRFKGQIRRVERIMTFNTEAVFVTTGTTLWVGARLNGVSDGKITAVNVGEAVGW